MRILYLLRHGEADAKPFGGNDHERPLAPAGRRDAKRVGAHVARNPIPPSLLLCSSALRAVETLRVVRSCLPGPAEWLCERDLYLADSDQILRRICEVDGRHTAVLLVGHNPGIGRLAHDLVRPAAGGDAERLRREFPAGALAVLRFDVDLWFDVAPRGAHLTEFTTPRQLASTR